MRRGRSTFFRAIAVAVIMKVIGRGRGARGTSLGPMSNDDRQFWDEMDRRRKARSGQDNQR